MSIASTITSRHNNGMFRNFVGWGVTTLLLLWLNRRNSDDNSRAEQPSKYTGTNVNQIGGVIPVVLGRAMIKNPLVSFYGDFDYRPYTEEYGAHTKFNWASLIPTVLLAIIGLCGAEDGVAGMTMPGPPNMHRHGIVAGQATTVGAGSKRSLIITTIVSLLLQLLTALLQRHLSKTTIQKGFKYYLGWQNILCWTGEHIGIKKIWMNVYDTEKDVSNIQGVWGSDKIAWKSDNPTGLIVSIDNENMFGGVDEGGGFVGDVRLYFGTQAQGRDSWMVKQMTDSVNVPANLKGLTPVYPMFFTCVVPKAYIGKQSTIPEMWFEVVNYPNFLQENCYYDIWGVYNELVREEYLKVLNYLSTIGTPIRNFLDGTLFRFESMKKEFLEQSDILATAVKACDDARYAYGEALLTRNHTTIADALAVYNQAVVDVKVEWEKILPYLNKRPEDSKRKTMKELLEELRANYPPTTQSIFLLQSDKLWSLLNNEVWHLGRLDDDLNPAEAIYEILTNKLWGCHYEGYTKININSLIKLGIQCETEGLGVSCLINKTNSANDYVNKILSHINGVKFDDPTTGQLTFKLIRNDYDKDSLKVFNVSNCESLEFSRLDWSETTSSISATFTNADDKYSTNAVIANDIANRLITGSYSEKQIDAEYFTTPANARVYAMTQLLSAAYPLSAVNIKCNRIAYNITIGEPIMVSWEPYGIKAQVFRVSDIDYGTLLDNTITITAIEDVFGFDKSMYEFSDSPSWTDPEKIPTDISRYMYLEYPYELSRNLDTYVFALAAQPSVYTVYWSAWSYRNGNYVKSAKTSSWSTVGKSIYIYSELYGEDKTGFEIKPLGVNGSSLLDDKIKTINNDPYTYNNDSGLNLLIIDDEIMSYDSIVRLPNGDYQIMGVIRGIFDTIPAEHSANSSVFFLDYMLNVNGTKPVCNKGETTVEQLELTAETIDTAQDFDLNKIESFPTTRRSEQPNIMANLQYASDMGSLTEYKYNQTGTLSYDILFKFNPRNKFNTFSKILSQLDNDSTVELNDDIKNVIRIVCNSNDFEIKYDAYGLPSNNSQSSITVIAIGDSQVAGNPVTNNKPSDIEDTYSWTNTVRKELNCIVHNLGVSSQTTTEIYARFDKDVIAHLPKYCIIGCGNFDYDAGIAVEVCEGNIIDMLDKCVANGITPILAPIWTIDPDYYALKLGVPNTDPAVEDIVKYMSKLKTDLMVYCNTNNITFINAVEAVETALDDMDLSYVTWNKSDLTADGNIKVGKFIAKKMKTLSDFNTYITYGGMTLKWEEFCKNMGNKVSINNDVVMYVKTYNDNESRKLYSYAEYYKYFTYSIPRIVGIVTSVDDVQAYADSIVFSANIVIPEGKVNSQFTMDYSECPLILIGTAKEDGILKGQDGVMYECGAQAFKIDGIDSTHKAIVREITIGEEFILRSNFNSVEGNLVDCFRYRNNAYTPYIPYKI